MLKSAVAAMLVRDLAALRREVEAYPDEQQLWTEVPGLPNAGGTLVLHLAGNIQHYIGRQLGGSSYVRDRPAEFSRRNVPRAELLAEIARAEAALAAIGRVTDAVLRQDFPETIGGSRLETGEFLVHIACHLTYHLGQLDYHRRMVTGDSRSVQALRPAELSTAHAVS